MAARIISVIDILGVAFWKSVRLSRRSECRGVRLRA
jgi:hypothetical protein